MSETYLELFIDAIRFQDDREMLEDELRDHLRKLEQLFTCNAELSSVLNLLKRDRQVVSRIGGEIVSSHSFRVCT